MTVSISLQFFLRSSKSGQETSVPRPPIQSPDRNQPVLVLHQRKRTQQDPFDPTEDGGGRADSQRQAEDGEYRKARAAPQHPECEAKVVKHIEMRRAQRPIVTNRRKRGWRAGLSWRLPTAPAVSPTRKLVGTKSRPASV